MTDYIEALLAEQEGEEARREREALSLRADAQEAFAEGAERDGFSERGELAGTGGSGTRTYGGSGEMGGSGTRPYRESEAAGGSGIRPRRESGEKGGSGTRPYGIDRTVGGSGTRPYGMDGAALSLLDGGPFESAQAAWADRALRESLAALPVSRGETRVVTVRTPERGGDGWSPEGLDRAFRRDARRFDGGFSLL